MTDQENSPARIMLETHYFFKPESGFLGLVKPGAWGWGPFVAIQPGQEDIVDATAIGLMLGFRRDPMSSQSFNVGIGFVVDPNARVLGDGIAANKPLPGNETVIRFKEQEQGGLLFLTSFSF